MPIETNNVVARLRQLRRRGLSYASDKPAVNLLLADMAEGLKEAAERITADQSLSDRIDVLEGERAWRPIETVPMDGSRIWLLGFDGSDFHSENKPRIDCAIIFETRWVQRRAEEWFEPVEGGLFRRHEAPSNGYWLNIPGQLEYVYGWRPYVAETISADEPVLSGQPLDTRGDDFDKLRASLTQGGKTNV